MKNSRLLFPCALSASCLLSSLLVTQTAHAQVPQGPSVSGIADVVQRLEPDNSSADATGAHPHAKGIPQNEIDLEDCNANLAYEFELSISNLNSGYNLNAWAGTADCSLLANREAATAVCWPVAQPVQANSNPFSMKIRMQDVVSQAFSQAHDVAYSPGGAEACKLQGSAPAANLALYFFFADAEGNPVGNVQSYPLVVDAVANPIALGDGGGGGEGGVASNSGNCAIGPRGTSSTGAFAFGLFAAAIALVRRRKRARA